MKPYFYDMMVAIGVTSPKWIQVFEQEFKKDPMVVQSAQKLKEAIDRLNEEYPAMKAPSYQQSDLLDRMQAHYIRYDWMVKQGCFFLSPEEPGYPDIMYRMDRTTGSRRGHFYPGVIYCKGDRRLLTKRIQILFCSEQPHGREVRSALTAIIKAMQAADCHPIIPLAFFTSWTLIEACLQADLAPIVILDRGIDYYLQSGDPTERETIEQVLQRGGVIMTNLPVGEVKPLTFPNQHRFYFMYALATRMHVIQLSHKDNSRFLLEAALRHGVRVCVLQQQALPPMYTDYYRKLPTLVQVFPLNEWLHL